MYIKKNGEVSNRCEEDYSDVLEGKVGYEQRLASILHEFDVSEWYYEADYIVPCKFFKNLQEYLAISGNKYVFVRHDALSPKDVMDLTVFERSVQGYEYMEYIMFRSPRVKEAIRLNRLVVKDYTGTYVARDIIPIEAEYRVLIVDGLTKWIIPDLIERGDEHHNMVIDTVKKFKIRYHRDNYCIDVVISDGKAIILELNPLLYGILDVIPYENIIDLRELD